MNDQLLKLEGLNGNHTVQSLKLSERLIKELIKGHETESNTIREDASLAVSEMDGIDWTTGTSVLAIIENAGEPGDDYILIYNWDGVMRMTGLNSDEHGHRSIYKVNEVRFN
jgi:hypothetical protein|tara:strand:- start:86 stop:421 length:336 start_codon:yes stop_codon:yes gene_type:complete